jgi:outer membrane protein assembly factor BamB
VETEGVLLLLPFNSTAAIAVDANTGAQLWQTPYLAYKASADNGVFYITNFHQALEARRAADGAVLWRLTDPSVNYSGVNAYGSTVYTTNEGLMLSALAAADGAVLWAAELPAFSATPQYSPAGEGGPSLIVPFGESGAGPSPGLACYDPVTGARRWTVGSLAGGDVGEMPVFPLTKFYTGCIGLPNEGLIYFYYVNGTLIWPESWNVGQDLAGLAYLNGEIGAWPT